MRAVSKCWQIVIFNEYTALEWPIKRSLSEHCSFVQSINSLCNSQISWSHIAIVTVQENGGKKKSHLQNQFLHLLCFVVHCVRRTRQTTRLGQKSHTSSKADNIAIYNIWQQFNSHFFVAVHTLGKEGRRSVTQKPSTFDISLHKFLITATDATFLEQEW